MQITHANKPPAAITEHNMVPVATLPPPEQLPAPGSGHRAGWVLGSKDNTGIAREFGMIKFQHFMFVPNPPFQRSGMFELGPKGDFSPSPPALPLLWCLSARIPTTQATGKPPHIILQGFPCLSPIIDVDSIIIVYIIISQ